MIKNIKTLTNKYIFVISMTVLFGLIDIPFVAQASVTGILAYPPLYNSVTYNSAILQGNVIENSDPSTCAWFEYSAGNFYQQSPAISTQKECGIISYTSFNLNEYISGLTPGTSYSFRVVAQDSIGLHYSASQTFTTLSAPQQNTANGQTSYNANSGAVTTFIQPTAITNEAMLVHENSAVINGTVNPENSPTSAWFEYSSDPNLYNANKSIPETVGSDNADKYMAYALSNLILGQTYYFRTVAQNSYGTTYGSIKSFTTRIAPVAITPTSTADQSTEPSSSLKTSNHQAPASSKLFSLEAEFDNNNPRPGKEIVYNISYENTGDSNASNVVLEVTLPNEAIYESSSYANVGKNGNTLSFKVGNVSAKSSGIISIKIKITDLTKSASLQFNDSLSYSESGKSGNTNLVSELKLNHNQLTASVIDLLGNILNNTIVDLLIGILTGLAIYHFAIRKKQNIITDDPLK